MFNTSPIYFETFTKRKIMVKLRRVYLHDKRLMTIFFICTILTLSVLSGTARLINIKAWTENAASFCFLHKTLTQLSI